MSNRRRVAMISQSYFLRDPRLRRAAAALAAAGYRVDVICLRDRDRGEHAHEVVDGVQVFRLPLTRRRGSTLRYAGEYLAFFGMATALLAARHLAHRYALVYVQNVPDVLVFAATVPRLLGARILLDLRDPMPEFLSSKYRLWAGHPLPRLAAHLEQASIRYADRAITVNEPVRQILIRRGAPPDKIGVVMNLADPASFARRARPPDPTRGRFVLLFAGTIAERYGLDLAVRAVARLRERIPGLVLRIVGEGDQLPELRRLVGELDVASRVELVPPVPYHEVSRLFQDADLGISPDRPNELFALALPNKVYEYVAIGLPAVVARTECLASYYPENVVRFFSPGDVDDLAEAILQLYRSPEERRARAEAGWLLTERWNWPRERSHFVRLVDSMLAHARPHFGERAASPNDPDVLVHPSAYVAADARLGARTRIWHFAQVREGASLGDDCILGKGAYVDKHVRIGNRVKIQNNASVYSGTTLEDGVFVGPYVCFTNDKLPRAVRPDGSLKGEEDWQLHTTVVRTGAAVGAGAIVVAGVTIGRWALVGAGAVVARDVPDHGLVVGNPARLIGYVCACARRLADEVSGSLECPHCGAAYTRDAAGVVASVGPTASNGPTAAIETA